VERDQKNTTPETRRTIALIEDIKESLKAIRAITELIRQEDAP
jgi:hypothetical protein